MSLIIDLKGIIAKRGISFKALNEKLNGEESKYVSFYQKIKLGYIKFTDVIDIARFLDFTIICKTKSDEVDISSIKIVDNMLTYEELLDALDIVFGSDYQIIWQDNRVTGKNVEELKEITKAEIREKNILY
ncbi:hypothetical protein [Clostridioides difficile]|uniref:hypothetical protein n=1 Tax=Clostridioides difficile TaxID=1496 RepID=UPI000D1DA9B2|nr:hypothetical protein [Clostridioides difficile]HBE9444669.1 hypothetical protein [Clostridioides difficile]